MTLQRIRRLPCWNGRPIASRLPGGLSNDNWKVVDDAGAHVVRFGADYPFHHVSRAREVLVNRAAHAAGFAPAVSYAAKGVMVTDFIGARTLAGKDLCDDPLRVAGFLRAFHQALPGHLAGEATLFWVFHVIRDYARTLRAGDSHHAASLPGYLDLAARLEQAQVPLPIIFGHNDLLPANFLDDGARLWLIDYEYAGFSTAMFDLAGVASHADMTPDQALALLTGYFGTAPDAATLRAFDAMQCAALLREAMWAMVSAIHLSAPGVDYDAYAATNAAKLDRAVQAFTLRHGSLSP